MSLTFWNKYRRNAAAIMRMQEEAKESIAETVEKSESESAEEPKKTKRSGVKNANKSADTDS